MFAHLPLDSEDRLGSIPIAVSIFFGDRDWMKRKGQHKAIERNKFKGVYSHEHLIENSDHHMYFDNPEILVQKILEDLSNLDEIKYDFSDLLDKSFCH